MRVFVAFASGSAIVFDAHFRGFAHVAVFDVHGHGNRATFGDVGHGFVDGDVTGVAFRGEREIRDGLCERDAGFGHADAFDDIEAGTGDHDGARVGVAYVFAGEDREATRDEAWVFASGKHVSEPVHRGVGVAATDAFDECTCVVVVLIA